MAGLGKDQRGITYLDLLLVLLVLLGVAALFAFPDLTAGLRGADRSREVGPRALAGSTAALVLVSGMVGTANPAKTAVESLVFTLASGDQSVRAVDLSPIGARVTYIDDIRAYHLPVAHWSATWQEGKGPLLDPGERVEIEISLQSLDPPLGPRTRFSIRVQAGRGAVLMIDRTTPEQFQAIMDIQ